MRTRTRRNVDVSLFGQLKLKLRGRFEVNYARELLTSVCHECIQEEEEEQQQ